MQALLGCVTITWQGANLVFMASLWGWEEQRPWERVLELSTSYSTVIISFLLNCFWLVENSNHLNILVLHLINVTSDSNLFVDASFPTLVTRFCFESGFLVFLSACDHFRYGLRQYCLWPANFNSFQEHYDSEESGSCHAGTMQFWIVRAFFLIGWLESEAVLVLNGNLQNHLNTSWFHPANVWHH